MTRSLLLLPAALMLPACQAEAPATEDANTAAVTSAAAVDVGAEEREIRGQVERWLGLVKAKDAKAIAALYTEDGAVMPPNAAIGKGPAAIEKVWAGMMAAPNFDLKFVPEQIIVAASGDMALDRGTYSLTMGPAEAQQKDSGKYVVVWRKVDGQWKAAADIFNSDLAPSGG